MSARDRDHKNTLAASGYARRRFLEHTALVTMGVSTAAALPSLSATESKAETQSGKCFDLKIPMKDVEGKVAFITGGSSGIGLGIARAFADAGMKVIISYRTKQRLEEALKFLESAGDRVHAIQLDVTDRPAMERAATEVAKIFGKVHVLVNNAGVALPPVLSADTSYVDWDWVLNVNLNGPFNGIHAFLPVIRSHGEGGQIITTSSVLGLFAVPGGAAYTASKFAVIGMMEGLRSELIDTNIGVSVFCPGMVKSNIEENSLRQRPSDSTVKDDPQYVERMRRARDNPALAMNPVEVGNIVLRGMRNNDLYILSHPEYEFIIRDRNEALIASIPQDLQPTQQRSDMHKRFPTSIYSIESDRRRNAETCDAKVKR